MNKTYYKFINFYIKLTVIRCTYNINLNPISKLLEKTLPLIYISSNSLVEIYLIPLIMILSRGISFFVLSCPLILISLSIWALLLLLLLIMLLLNSNHPGGGCLIETRVKLFGCLVLLVLLLVWSLVGF